MAKSKKNKGNQQGQAQAQGSNKGKVKPDKDLEEEEDNEDDFDLMNEDEDVDDFDDDGELFWTLTVTPDQEAMLEEPANPNSIICVTHACFGEEVNKDSRTVLYCTTSASEDPVPICILNSANESRPLNLRFGSPASFSLKGRNPSTVYLSGYLQPELSSMMDDMGDMEDMDDEDIDLEEEDEPRFPGKSRKRGAPEEDIEEPTAKKRKIEAQKAEPKKADSKKNTPNKPQQPQSQQSTPANNQSATSTPGDKPLSKTQLKKQKKQQKQQQNKDEKKDDKPETQETAVAASSNTTEKKTDETPKEDKSKSQKTDAKNNVETKDLKVGTGAVVQNGQTLNLYYVGQLEDKTVFEKHLSGNGFEFKLGSQDTIQGLSLGIKGMKVGGKRRITVPAKLAYGEEGNADKKIPANATLTFTVEVREAK